MEILKTGNVKKILGFLVCFVHSEIIEYTFILAWCVMVALIGDFLGLNFSTDKIFYKTNS